MWPRMICRTRSGAMEMSHPSRTLDLVSMTVPTWDHGRERILNAHPIPPRWTNAPYPGPIPVTVRIEWEHTGPQQIDTLALAWTRTLALIRVNDPRHPLNNAWVRAADVRRR